jgi:5-methylthioribose kinase
MGYAPLDTNSLLTYVMTRPALEGFRAAPSQLRVTEVGDGNLNLVFVVENSDDPGRSFVLKQALPYLRVVGDSWPLTRERARYESQALRKYNELTPGLAPQLYDYDEEMSVVVMEYLGKHEIMRKPLVARRRFPRFVDHITTYLAASLFYTSDMYLSGIEKKRMQAQFVNEELRKLQEDFVYTHPFMESPENHWNSLLDHLVKEVRADSELKLAVAEMKNAYMNQSEALIHADLHTGSIMVNEADTRVIDPEFAFIGPMAYDVGALLQNLVLNYLSHFAHTADRDQREEYQTYILDTVKEIWLGFAAKFDALWAANNRGDLVPTEYWQFQGGEAAFARFRRDYLARLLQEMAGHAGTKFLRRMMGIVSVWDISSITDPVKRAGPERAAIRIGVRWAVDRKRYTTIDDLLTVVRETVAAERLGL